MKNLSYILSMFYVAGFCLFVNAAAANFPATPKPRPATAPQDTAAQAQTSAPAPVQAAPPVVNVSPPNVNVAAPNVSVSPQLVAPPAGMMDEIKGWLNTTFLGLITALFGWIGIRGVKSATPGAPIAAPAIVTDVLAKLHDPVAKEAIETRALQIALAAVESGLPKSLIQGAVGLAPVGGTINAAYDATVGPLIHSLGVKTLQDLIAKQGVAQ